MTVAARLGALLLLAGLLPQCSRSAGDQVDAGHSGSSRRLATCRPQHLAGAAEVKPVKLARGCRFRSSARWPAPEIVDTTAKLDAVLSCSGGANASIDLKAHDLFLFQYTLSPASGGASVYDDGSKLTLVSRSRVPCGNEPRAMPLSIVLGYAMPKGAKRTYANASCVVASVCK